MIKLCLGLLLAALVSTSVSACDLCAVYSVSQARGETGKGFHAGVAEQFTHYGTLQEDGSKAPNPAHQRLDSSISQVFAGYNFTERFGLQINVPVIYRDYRRANEAGGIETGTEAGLGDVLLIGNFALYRHETRHATLVLNLLGGVKFPTGSSSRLKEEFEEVEEPVGPPGGVHGHDLALGSGSVDGLVGASLFGRRDRLLFHVAAQYAIRSEGDHDYRFADDLTWSTGPGVFLLLSESRTLTLEVVCTGEHKEKDRFQGASAEDTGLTAVFVGPLFRFTYGERLSADLAIDLPVHIENTALQAVADYRVRAGITWRF